MNPSSFHHLNVERHLKFATVEINKPEAQQVHVLQLFRVYHPPPAEKQVFQRAFLCATSPRRRPTVPPSGEVLYCAVGLI